VSSPARTRNGAIGGPRLLRHQVEQVVGVVERALALNRHLVAELGGDVVQGALEVGGELARISTGRAPGHAVALDEQDPMAGRSQGEEGRGHTGDACAQDRDVGGRVRRERTRRPSGANCAIHGDRLGRSV
jgi:hypothetical protein